MIRLFKHYVPHSVLLLGLIDFLLLIAAGEAGWLLRLWQIGGEADPADAQRLPHLLVFAVVLQLTMVGVGVYWVDALRSMRIAAARLMVAVSLGVLLLSLIFFLLPAVTFWRSNLLYAMALALGLLFAARLVFGRALEAEAKMAEIILEALARPRSGMDGEARRLVDDDRLAVDE